MSMKYFEFRLTLHQIFSDDVEIAETSRSLRHVRRYDLHTGRISNARAQMWVARQGNHIRVLLEITGEGVDSPADAIKSPSV